MATSIAVHPTTSADGQTQHLRRWCTTVWDDPVNLMDYVTEVFVRYFGYPRARCEHLMLQVHVNGRAIVSEGARERMEADVVAMHSYGLHATLEELELP